ncbi:MAG: glycosyltransferase family 9 protein, partial [Limisphaerales bacterium]
AGSKDLLTGNPNLTNIYQKNLLKTSTAGGLRFLWPLRKAGYDVSINTHPQSRIHYRGTARFVGARTRISHIYDCSGVIDHLLVNRTWPQDYQKHSVENNLDLLTVLQKRPLLPSHSLDVFLGAAEEEWADLFLKANGLRERQRLGIHVGSGGTKNLSLKRWPLEHYVELVKKLRHAMPELAILLFGGPEEDPELERIHSVDKSPLTVRVKSQNLRQAGALMKRCTAFLSVDTALMHLAAAVRAPGQVVIEAPTFNKTNEPYGNKYVLVRNPAVGGRNLEYYRYDGEGIHGTPEELRRVMASVSVEAVYDAVRQELRQR